MYDCLAVWVAEGSLASLAFWVLGLPSPVLWGVVTALLSLIPIIGSAAVWGPAVIILVIGGHWWKGRILLGWGAGGRRASRQLGQALPDKRTGKAAHVARLLRSAGRCGSVRRHGAFSWPCRPPNNARGA